MYARELADREAAIAVIAHLQVGERVEMGPELHRPGHDLGDPVDIVLPHAAARVGVVRGGHERLLEVTAGEDGHALVEHVPQVVRPTVFHQRQRVGAFGVVDQGELSQRVDRRGGHSEDQGSRKLGNRVRPPSTKIV